jgi:hypothetical protein
MKNLFVEKPSKIGTLNRWPPASWVTWGQLGLVELVNLPNGSDEYVQETIDGRFLPDTSRNFVRDYNLTNDWKSPLIQTALANQPRLLQAMLKNGWRNEFLHAYRHGC